ncbi:MAG: NADP-dependent phosphogluconate dehydrogenase, partial [bacterium]
KMVHNGIEYGLMQLLAETYDLMHRGLGLDRGQLQAVYENWNRTELSSYLVEITARIFQQNDEKTGKPLLELILDEAAQKGTGKWTAQDAMDLQTPVPTINAAVAMRDLSGKKSERVAASQILAGEARAFSGNRDSFILQIQNALYAGMIITFAQSLALLRAASRAYNYGLNLESVARLWRGGCIIRAALLEDIHSVYAAQPDLSNLLMDASLAQKVLARQEDWRAVVHTAVELGIPAPALTASLFYFDGWRSARLPANLIQAQRDYFGAHTYKRVDAAGVFHTKWS